MLADGGQPILELIDKITPTVEPTKELVATPTAAVANINNTSYPGWYWVLLILALLILFVAIGYSVTHKSKIKNL